MTPIDFLYPFDPNGTSTANRIVDERHTITPANGRDFNFFIPRATPYFESSMVIKHVATGQALLKGIDWTPSYKFESASNTAPYLQIYAGISILTTQFDGAVLSLEYQTLGGAYTLSEANITTILANVAIDPRLTSWESVSLKPGIYLPEPHLHNIAETMGYDDLVAAIRELVDTFTLESSNLAQLMNSHIRNENNPHSTDLVKLGIERFADVFKATIEEANLGIDDKNFTTVAIVKHMLETLEPNIEVTKEMVGLGLLNNWPAATQIEAVNGAPQRYLSADVFRAALNEVLATLPIAQVNNIQIALNNHLSNMENPHNTTTEHLGIGKANSVVGVRGDIAFHNGSFEPLDMSADRIINSLGVVNTPSELAAQLAYREPIAAKFSRWSKLSFADGLPQSASEELTGWSINQSGVITSSIDSTSLIGVLSPEQIVGDYTFEVEIGANSDAGNFIGVCLGLVETDEGHRILAALRSADSTEGTILKLTTMDLNGESILDSKVLPAAPANGWNGYRAVGAIKLKVVKVGGVYTASTTDAGTGYTHVVTADLSNDPTNEKFLPISKLGYLTQSQPTATWTTISLPELYPAVFATHTNQIHNWNGTAYVVSTDTPATRILSGRLYRNTLTNRVYEAISDGVLSLFNGNSVVKDISRPTVVSDRLAHIDSDGRMTVGNYVDHWSQHPTTGAMTYRGFTAKTEASGYDIRSAGLNSAALLWLGDETKRHAAVRAETSGAVGFTNIDGVLVAYLDSTGVFQHQGINRTSDVRVKDGAREIDYEDINIDSLGLYEWTWATDKRIPEHMWGKRDSGVLAQEVRAKFPGCVSLNEETGLLTVDDAKLATHLSIIVLKRLKALESKE